jgi:hypothetical protein
MRYGLATQHGQQTLMGALVLLAFLVVGVAVVLFAVTSTQGGSCDPGSALPWLRC